MKYIDAEKLKGFVRELKERAKRNSCDTWGIVPDALEEVEDFIDSLQQEQESVAERFARIVRGNLIGIDKKVQQEFEHLYFEITGNKMYGGYRD